MRDYELLIRQTPKAYQGWLAEESETVCRHDVVVLYRKHELPERNDTNEMERYLPDHLIIGDDSGDNVFVLQCSPESPVWVVDVGSLRLADLKEVSPSFMAWQKSDFQIPESPGYHLPLRADVYIDRVSDIETMFALKKFLGQEWGALQIKGLLATQPFLAIKLGTPIAFEQRLKRQPDLKPFLFFERDGKLERISS